MVPKAKKLKVLKINVYLKIKNIKSTVAHILPPLPLPHHHTTVHILAKSTQPPAKYKL